MPRLSLYVTDENFTLLRAQAEGSGLSMSKYVNRLIEQDARHSGWPKGFWDLYGALGKDVEIPDDPPPTNGAELEQVFA